MTTAWRSSSAEADPGREAARNRLDMLQLRDGAVADRRPHARARRPDAWTKRGPRSIARWRSRRRAPCCCGSWRASKRSRQRWTRPSSMRGGPSRLTATDPESRPHSAACSRRRARRRGPRSFSRAASIDPRAGSRGRPTRFGERAKSPRAARRDRAIPTAAHGHSRPGRGDDRHPSQPLLARAPRRAAVVVTDVARTGRRRGSARHAGRRHGRVSRTTRSSRTRPFDEATSPNGSQLLADCRRIGGRRQVACAKPRLDDVPAGHCVSRDLRWRRRPAPWPWTTRATSGRPARSAAPISSPPLPA